MRKLLAVALAASLALSAGPILPRAWQAARLLLGPRDTEAVAAYQLAALTPADYAAEVEKALADGDADLAASLVDLAARQQVPLPPALLEQTQIAVRSSKLKTAADAWAGFLSGDAENEPALAGAIAADMTGFGDARDLYREARAYHAGEPVDRVTVAFASVGLTLTAATVVTMGGALPAKAGISTVKAVHRAGRLSPALTRYMGELARTAVNNEALADLGRSLRTFNPAGTRAAARNLLRPESVAMLRQLGEDVATIGKNGGYRGSLDALAAADDAAGVQRVARLSQTYGRGLRATLLFVGSAALTVASVLLGVIGWLLGALAWLAGALWLIFRAALWTVKKFRPASPVHPGGLSAPQTPRGYFKKG